MSTPGSGTRRFADVKVGDRLAAGLAHILEHDVGAHFAQGSEEADAQGIDTDVLDRDVAARQDRRRYDGEGGRGRIARHDDVARLELLVEDQKIRVAQGVSGAVVDKGSLFEFIPYLMQGVRHALQDMGSRDISALHKALHSSKLRFEPRSLAAQAQGGVHGLYSYKKPIIGAE